ncbi:amino acid adenylation domain-containing protein (plasmid) [Streptomyces sp. NBC_01351]|uniref:amino acid adenylation domain-containing protein n=1 Tax=Streptomyces sp. NBC_01351 TaxID=2903833 RepID=UPI002E32D7EB|nr:amino acid adenylation domain-containing protein [Streptomyces sp. NBC_01351]
MVSAAHPSSIAGEVRPVAAESVVHLVRGHARTRPDAVAVRSGPEQVTYRQLWQRALAVAAALAEAGAGPGDRVALWADRTAGAVAGALGVMALGAAYVPIDPSHPGERTASVLAGAAPVALLHDGAAGGGTLPSLTVPVIDVRELPAPPGLPEPALPGADDIAYVVFTSGSTGTPKGVMVEHGSLVNYVSWCGDLVGGAGDGSPLFGSLGFDLAMTTLWVPLAQGRTVTTVAGIWDQETLFGERGEAPYSFVKMTPSHARFFEVLAQPPRYDRVTKLLMFGGEGLDPALISSLGSRLDGVRLVNHYGPTETTIGCCAYRFDRDSVPSTPTVPIGRPAWNTRAYVVDEQLRPVAPGAPGELVIAGRAVAAGYLGGAGAGKFLDEGELGGPAGGRAYRTGDTVELLAEGALLYLGRGDDQLKVNGYRVELGELRHHVLSVPGVADAAFDIVRGPVDALELFVRLGGQGPRPDAQEFAALVRKTLAAALPSALVPNAVHLVDEIVVNANGKTDIGATRARTGR